MFLPDRFVKGELPALRRRRPVRRQLRGLRRDLPADRARRTRARVSAGATPVRTRIASTVLQARRLRGDAARAGSAGGDSAGRGRQQARRVVRSRPAGLGHLARRALLRLRDPRRARQVLLRLARRADRLHGAASETCATAPACDFDDCWGTDSDAELVPLHRQGHRLLPHPVLAGDAARRRLPHARPRVRPRLPDRQRREDVEVARHLHHGAHLPRPPRPGVPALLLRQPSSADGIDDIDLNLDEFAATGQQPTWSASSSTSPAAAPASSRAARRGWRRRCRSRRCSREFAAAERRDRRAYEARELPRGHARDHGAGRPRQPVHRPAQALGAGEGPGARRRGAGRLHVGLNLFRAADRSTWRRCCRRMAEQAEAFLRSRRSRLGATARSRCCGTPVAPFEPM